MYEMEYKNFCDVERKRKKEFATMWLYTIWKQAFIWYVIIEKYLKGYRIHTDVNADGQVHWISIFSIYGASN